MRHFFFNISSGKTREYCLIYFLIDKQNNGENNNVKLRTLVSDGAEYIFPYFKRHGYLGLFLTNISVFQFNYGKNQNLGDGKVASHDETLVAMVRCHRCDRRCRSSSNSC